MIAFLSNIYYELFWQICFTFSFHGERLSSCSSVIFSFGLVSMTKKPQQQVSDSFADGCISVYMIIPFFIKIEVNISTNRTIYDNISFTQVLR